MLIARNRWIFLALTALLWLLLPAESLFAQQPAKYTLPAGKSRNDIHPASFYIKFKNGSNNNGARTLGPAPDITLSTLADKIPVKSTKALDPVSNAAAARSLSKPSKYLHNLYKVTLSEGDVLEAINELLQYENVAYAVPVFKESLLLAPNDPDAALNSTRQAYLSSVKAYDAWNITKGDSTIVIGIVDTGVEYTHEDLAANLSFNLSDPIDGVDNDGNGYIDDYRGWDFADNDNNPLANTNGHGTHVAGVAAARTNNGKGMAGAGWNTKYLPLKGFRSTDNTSFGTYEAIIYAANQRIDVLNLSWGSVNTFSQAAQDIINYAVLEKNVVVIAAAGNTNEELTFYPASYDHVLSVAASTNDGTKSSFGTYGYYVDLVAPGASIYSTRNGNSYGSDAGSSYAAPLVSGAAGILKSHRPTYTALQLMEQLRVTADPVDNLAGNASYKGLLGKGMLNMHRALTDTISPSVRLVGDSLYSQAGQQAYYGDTIYIDLQATNWLRPATGLQINIESLSELALLLPASWSAPALSTFDTTRHSLRIILKEDTPPGSRIVLKAGMEATGYTDVQYLQFVTAPDTASITSPALQLTLSSAGELGYTADSLAGGNGFRFKGEVVLRQTGFMLGTGKDKLADNVVKNFNHSTRNEGFEPLKHLKPYSYAAADQYYENSFMASLGETQQVLVEQKTMAWESEADSNFLITEYRITNTSAEPLEGLHAGLFSNWDLDNLSQNHTTWVDSLQLGLTYNHNGGYFTGIALLSDHTATWHAADLGTANGNTADVGEILTDSAKYAWLSADFIKSSAGLEGNGNNTAQVNGVNLGILAAYSSEKIAFAWLAAASEEALVQAAQQARIRYTAIKYKPRPMATFYACRESTATISLPNGTSWNFYSDPTAEAAPLYQGNDYETGVISEPTKLYVRNADQLYAGEIYAVQINLDPISAEFAISEDPVLLESGTGKGVTFSSKGENTAKWEWDFGNGIKSSLKEPQSKYDRPGQYTVRLTTTSAAGCVDTSEKLLTVAHRAPLPQLLTQYVCKNSSASLQAVNAGKIRVYRDVDGKERIFEGAAYNTGAIAGDTIFYVSNADSLYESHLLPVKVLLNNPLVSFEVLPDTTTFEKALLLVNTSGNATAYKWFVGDTLLSQEKNATIRPGDASELTVRMQAVNEQGCQEETSQLLSFKKSAMPVVSNENVCPGDTYTLKPQNGDYFLFSASDGSPLHKGRNFRIESIVDTLQLFVQGVDDLYESDPVEAFIYPFDFEAAFTIDPEKLVLEDQKTANFIDVSRGAESWQWKINGRITEVSQNPVLAFDSAGVYDITLLIGNSAGCVDSVSKSFRVLDVTSLPVVPAESFTLFPNPAEETISIYLNHHLPGAYRLEIADMAGRTVKSLDFTDFRPQVSMEIDISELASGVYTLKIAGKGSILHRKFIRK